jgi:hypothetical protein
MFLCLKKEDEERNDKGCVHSSVPLWIESWKPEVYLASFYDEYNKWQAIQRLKKRDNEILN